MAAGTAAQPQPLPQPQPPPQPQPQPQPPHLLSSLRDACPDVFRALLARVAQQAPTALLALARADRGLAAALRGPDAERDVWRLGWEAFERDRLAHAQLQRQQQQQPQQLPHQQHRPVPSHPPPPDSAAGVSYRDRLRLAGHGGCMLCADPAGVAAAVHWQHRLRACDRCLRAASVSEHEACHSRGADGLALPAALLLGLPSHRAALGRAREAAYGEEARRRHGTRYLLADVERRAGASAAELRRTAGERRAAARAERVAAARAARLEALRRASAEREVLARAFALMPPERRRAARRASAERLCAERDAWLTPERLARSAAFLRFAEGSTPRRFGGPLTDATRAGLARVFDAVARESGLAAERARRALEAEAAAAARALAADVVGRVGARVEAELRAGRDAALRAALAALGLERRADSTLCDAFVEGREARRGADEVALVMARFRYLYEGHCPAFDARVREARAQVETAVEGLRAWRGRFYPGIFADACEIVLDAAVRGGERGLQRHLAERWTDWPARWPWLPPASS